MFAALGKIADYACARTRRDDIAFTETNCAAASPGPAESLRWFWGLPRPAL